MNKILMTDNSHTHGLKKKIEDIAKNLVKKIMKMIYIVPGEKKNCVDSGNEQQKNHIRAAKHSSGLQSEILN